MDRLGNARERLDVVVGVELRSEERGGEGVRVNVRRADDDEPDPAPRPLPVVLGRHVGEDATAVHPGRAGRREDDAVPDLGSPDPPGREEPRIFARHPLPPERVVLGCRPMGGRMPADRPLCASRRVCSGACGGVKNLQAGRTVAARDGPRRLPDRDAGPGRARKERVHARKLPRRPAIRRPATVLKARSRRTSPPVESPNELSITGCREVVQGPRPGRPAPRSGPCATRASPPFLARTRAG